MSVDWNGGSKKTANWLKWPTVGSSYNFGKKHGPVVSFNKIESNKGFNYTRKVPLEINGEVVRKNGKVVIDPTPQDLGFRHIIEFSDGAKISLSYWKLYYAMEDIGGVREGDMLYVDHPATGKWVVITEPMQKKLINT